MRPPVPQPPERPPDQSAGYSRTRKSGLPPGSLIHIGRRYETPVSIEVFDYDADRVDEFACADTDACLAYVGTERTGTWINVDSVSDTALVAHLGTALGIHPLVQEDIVNTTQRPKLEAYDGYLYLVLRMIQGTPPALTAEQVSFIIRPDMVLTFQEQDYPGDVFDPVRERLRHHNGKIRHLGNDYLAYALIDVVVDSYFGVIEQISEAIEAAEERVIDDPHPDTLAEVNALRRQVLLLRKAVWPLRDAMSTLARVESPLVDEHTRLYFRDVHDHVIQVVEMIETFRDVLTSVHDLYLSSLSQRTNEVMQFLTIIGTIFIPLTFIAGIYGMNFDHMPELHWRWSYPLLWAVMTSVAVGLIFYFKRRRWL